MKPLYEEPGGTCRLDRDGMPCPNLPSPKGEETRPTENTVICAVQASESITKESTHVCYSAES